MLRDITYFGQELIRYTHADGIKDGVIRDFDVHIHICRDNFSHLDNQDTNDNIQTLKNAVRMSSRAMIDCNRRRALFFHRFSNVCSGKGTSAKLAANEEYFKLFIEHLHIDPDKLWVKSVTGDMKATERMKIFNEFQQPPTDGIYRILVNCQVIGMGVDLRCIDMVTFVDPRHSFVTITQNISRGIRKNEYDDRPSVIMIPLTIDESKLVDTKIDERSDALKDILRETCFERLANFVNALKNMDHRWHDQMLFLQEKDQKKKKEKKEEDKSEEEEEEEKQSEKVIKEKKTRNRIQFSVDPELQIIWDVDPKDLIKESKKTLKLMCKMNNEKVDLKSRLLFIFCYFCYFSNRIIFIVTKYSWLVFFFDF